MPLGLTAAELRAEWVLLLDLEWASTVIRWSSGPEVVISSEAGDLTYHGGLPVSWEDAADLLSTSTAARSLSFPDLHFPAHIDVPALVAAGHDLAAARAQVSVWAPGRTHEQRIPLLSGRVYAPTYGAAGEPVGLTIESRAFEDRALLIPEDARVSPTTWPAADSSAHGRPYPLVIGKPGRYTEADGSEGKTTGSPAYPVDVAGKRFLIAGHKVQATMIRLINIDKGEARDETIEHVQDGLGRVVATCVVSGTGLSVVEGDEYWARWDDGLGATDAEGGTLHGAGEVLRYLLRRSSIPYDRGRTYAALRQLDQYQIDTYADDPEATIWDYIADNLLPILPLSVVTGPRGLRPILLQPDPRQLDAIDHINAGPQAQRASQVQYSTAEPIQRVQIEYAPRGDSGDYLRTCTLSGDSADSARSVPLRKSAQRYVRDGEGLATLRIETDLVYDTATAELIAGVQAALHAMPYREITYDCDPSRWGYLEPGDVLTLTDPDLALTDQVCIVQAISWSATTVQVQLVLPATL